MAGNACFCSRNRRSRTLAAPRRRGWAVETARISTQTNEGSDTVGKYILKRVAMAVLTIYLVSTITFFLMNLVPGGRNHRIISKIA